MLQTDGLIIKLHFFQMLNALVEIDQRGKADAEPFPAGLLSLGVQ
jgi:hypothetical protein